MLQRQRLVLVISILASAIAFLDSSIVNVALPAIAKDLGGNLAVQQWIVDGYLITLGALILLAGSLSDLLGRKRILDIGLIGFAVTSLLCAFAPDTTILIIARALQGVAGALLVPSSLALIISTFKQDKAAKAIGQWTAWTGISFIIGPLLGGFLVDQFSWRLIFGINIIPIGICLALLRLLSEPEKTKKVPLDILGAVLCSGGLALTVFGLIEQPNYGWDNVLIYGTIISGLILLGLFIFSQTINRHAMLDLTLFRIRNFAVGNLATTAIYGGLSIATFIIVIFLQEVGKYSAIESGLALLPITIIMFFFSPRFGALAGKFGPRLFMTLGPLAASSGFLLMLRVDSSLSYVTQLLPGIIVFALGLSMTVAPLTSAVLKDIPSHHAGIASAVNNAISRIAGLLGIAFIGLVVGTKVSLEGFHTAIIFTAVLLLAGGIVSFIGIRNSPSKTS